MKIDQWDGIKSTEISCYAAGQPIFSKCAKAIGVGGGNSFKKTVLQKSSASHKQKSKAGSYTSHYIQNLTQNGSETQLNMTPKMVKLLEENRGINLCDID